MRGQYSNLPPFLFWLCNVILWGFLPFTREGKRFYIEIGHCKLQVKNPWLDGRWYVMLETKSPVKLLKMFWNAHVVSLGCLWRGKKCVCKKSFCSGGSRGCVQQAAGGAAGCDALLLLQLPCLWLRGQWLCLSASFLAFTSAPWASGDHSSNALSHWSRQQFC